MNFTPSLRAAIRARIRDICGRGVASIHVGLRDNVAAPDGRRDWTPNGLLWVEDSDLCDLVPLGDVSEVAERPDAPGCVTLDCYVYVRARGSMIDLDRNCYVTIRDGVVLDVHDRDLEADERATALLGVPHPYGRR